MLSPEQAAHRRREIQYDISTCAAATVRIAHELNCEMQKKAHYANEVRGLFYLDMATPESTSWISAVISNILLSFLPDYGFDILGFLFSFRHEWKTAISFWCCAHHIPSPPFAFFLFLATINPFLSPLFLHPWTNTPTNHYLTFLFFLADSASSDWKTSLPTETTMGGLYYYASLSLELPPLHQSPRSIIAAWACYTVWSVTDSALLWYEAAQRTVRVIWGYWRGTSTHIGSFRRRVDLGSGEVGLAVGLAPGARACYSWGFLALRRFLLGVGARVSGQGEEQGW